MRTCIGCRTRTTTDELLRTVLIDDEVCPDPARRLPGRGAFLHFDPACLDLAVRRRAFSRAFRVRMALDVAALRALLTGAGSSPAERAPRPRRTESRKVRPK
ncbi:MAG: YlxR family protein [Mycobacteriales bacterium]